MATDTACVYVISILYFGYCDLHTTSQTATAARGCCDWPPPDGSDLQSEGACAVSVHSSVGGSGRAARHGTVLSGKNVPPRRRCQGAHALFTHRAPTAPLPRTAHVHKCDCSATLNTSRTRARARRRTLARIFRGEPSNFYPYAAPPPDENACVHQQLSRAAAQGPGALCANAATAAARTPRILYFSVFRITHETSRARATLGDDAQLA